MVNYGSDAALEEIHDEMYQEEEKRPKGIFSQLSTQTKFIFGAILAIIIILVAQDKLQIKNALFYSGAIILLLYLLKGTDPSRRELTYIECLIRLNEILKFLQIHPIGDVPQIPKGDIHVMPIGRKQWYNGKGWKRSFGVDIYDNEIDTWEHHFAEVDVFTGDIISFKHMPEGVDGDETRDLITIPGHDMLLEKKRQQYMDKSYKV